MPGLDVPDWHYRTRYRVDDDSIRTRVWNFDFDWDGSEWADHVWRRRYDQADAILMGDRLAIEVSPGVVAVFETSGFAGALQEYCDGQVPFVVREAAE